MSADELETVTHTRFVFGIQEGDRYAAQIVDADIALVPSAKERQVAERAGRHALRDPGIMAAELRRRPSSPLGGIPILGGDALAGIGDVRLGFGVGKAARKRERSEEDEDRDEREDALHGCTGGEGWCFAAFFATLKDTRKYSLRPIIHPLLALLHDLLYSKNIHCADWEYRPTSVNPQSKSAPRRSYRAMSGKLGGTLRTDAWSPT